MKILFVTARPPWPGRRGDQARVGGFATIFQARHDVHIVAVRPPRFAVDEPPHGVDVETVPLGRAGLIGGLLRGLPGFVTGRRPLQAALFDQRRLRDTVARAVDRIDPDVVVVVLSRLADLLPVVEDRPVVLDLIDALGLNMRRRADRGGWLRPLWSAEAGRLSRWEAAAVARVDRATVVADRDRRAILDGAPETLRSTIDARLRVVPFGLDLDRAESSDRSGMPTSVSPTLITSGNLGYFPTVEGVRWFATEVWPRIQARRPDVRWRLAGARPGRSIRELAHRPGVELIADPAELRPLVRGADVAVAPLRAGSGTPIKILEAMADGVPVVTTSDGAGGLDALPDEALAIVDDPSSFAEAVLRALDEPEQARRSIETASGWLERHRLGATADAFETVLDEAVSAGRRPAPR
ncbi:MAG: glycosyltransferase [Acidobacteriota bacterium]